MIQKVKVHEKGVVLETYRGEVLLEAVEPGIIRFGMGGSTSVESPLGIEAMGREKLEINETVDQICLFTGLLSIAIDKQTGEFCWRDLAGGLLLRQPFPQLTPQEVTRYSTGGEEPVIRRVKTVDGERNFVENLHPYKDRMAFRAKVGFIWQKDEAIHGLGQAEEGVYDYRGTTQYLYQHNMRIPMPFFTSTQQYGVLFDCGSLMTFTDDARGSYLFLDTLDRLTFYFIHSKSLDGIIGGYRRLTGKARLLPRWAYGYLQSREAYRNEEELVGVAEEYRRRKIPLDGVIQDWNTWEPGLWGNKRVDKKRFSHLELALEKLHKLNVHALVSVWPNMNMGGEDYQEFSQAGTLLGDNATYDAFNPDARQMYWEQAEKELFAAGFDGWWCDSTEPFSGPDWGGETLREPWERYLLVGEEHKKYLDPAKANLYALAHAKGMYENQRESTSAKRVVNLTRSGSAGIQKYGAVLWSGDISARWDVLEKQITEGLNLCMSGLPWWTLDIGGFFTVKDQYENRGCGCHEDTNPLWFWQGDYNKGRADLGYCELYVRWLQLGVFLPMFRSHGTDTPREIWFFDHPELPFYSVIEKYIRLRYSLLPYIYSLAGRVVQEDYTMMRSLLFDYSHDPVARTISNQFMFGGDLLVCPVLTPLYYQAECKPLASETPKTRSCYLPEGNDWYDFWTGEKFAGGGWIEAPAPLETMPIYIKAGAVIPMESQKLEYASQLAQEPLQLRIWPGADGAFTLYEDSGDGYGYEKGEYNRISIFWDDRERVLTIGETGHTFENSICGRGVNIQVGGKTARVYYNGEKVEIRVD